MTLATPTPDWHQYAACLGSFGLFTIPDTKDNRDRIGQRRFEAEAKAVCAGCSVRAECLAAGIASGDEYSIYGGLTPNERRAGRTPIPHGSSGGYKAHYRIGEKPCEECKRRYYDDRNERRRAAG